VRTFAGGGMGVTAVQRARRGAPVTTARFRAQLQRRLGVPRRGAQQGDGLALLVHRPGEILPRALACAGRLGQAPAAPHRALAPMKRLVQRRTGGDHPPGAGGVSHVDPARACVLRRGACAPGRPQTTGRPAACAPGGNRHLESSPPASLSRSWYLGDGERAYPKSPHRKIATEPPHDLRSCGQKPPCCGGALCGQRREERLDVRELPRCTFIEVTSCMLSALICTRAFLTVRQSLAQDRYGSLLTLSNSYTSLTLR
jgi:hypothetical protein